MILENMYDYILLISFVQINWYFAFVGKKKKKEKEN